MGASSGRCRVSVVIPAYNEGSAVAGVVREVREAMEHSPHAFEILVVDDCSTDNTAALAEQQGARVIRHPENRGSGASRKTGIRAAAGEWIVMIDADGSYPAHVIPRLLEHMPAFSQVIGARTEEMGTHRLLRTLAKEAIRRLAAFLVGRPIPDLNTGLRAFHKADMVPFLYLVPDGFSCVSSMTLAFMTNNLPVRFVPVPYYRRIGKSKFHPIKDTYKYLITVIRIVSYFAPLNVFMPLCLLLLGLGFLKGVVDLLWTRTLQESDIILMLAGVMVGALGVLADLIVVHGKRNGGRDV
jgi:glycosyltransferase involved in cell wall biosynthesis